MLLEAEEILTSKIKNSKSYLEEYNRSRSEAANELEECRKTEQKNAFGNLKGSVLNVTVIQAAGLTSLDK